MSSSSTRCREERRARKIVSEEHAAKSLSAGPKVRSAEARGGGLAAVVLHSTHYDFVTNICFVIFL